MARLALRGGARPALGVGGVVEEVHVQVAAAVVVEKHGLGGVAGEVESILLGAVGEGAVAVVDVQDVVAVHREMTHGGDVDVQAPVAVDVDRKSTRLNSSHSQISYAVFCLKKKRYAT